MHERLRIRQRRGTKVRQNEKQRREWRGSVIFSPSGNHVEKAKKMREEREDGEGGERKRERELIPQRWITHDCLAWNYSIPPPPSRRNYPLGSVRHAFIQLCIHHYLPRVSLLGPSTPKPRRLFSCYYFPACGLVSRRLFLRAKNRRYQSLL